MTRIKRILALVMDVLREIFDESAYARFLVHRHLSSNRSAYAAFLREQESVKARRPRCC